MFVVARGDIAVSTAKHEFYGISVIEAVRAGCIPFLPNRLSYPELFPAEYLYENKNLFAELKLFLENPLEAKKSAPRWLTDRFSWDFLRTKYLDWFAGTASSL